MPHQHRPTRSTRPRRARAHGRRQWAWIAAAALVGAAVVTTVVVVGPSGGHRDAGGPDATAGPSASTDRPVVGRKSAADAFPGGLARQPEAVNQPGIRERRARAEGREDTADRIAAIADQPIATWLTDTSRSATRETVRTVVRAAERADATPVFVLYNVPDRDCGNYSRGGTEADAYLPWVRSAAEAMSGSGAVVLVEPDSVAQIGKCDRLRDTRLPLLRKAVDALSGHGLTVYLDGGNENRVPVDTMADRLRRAGVDRVQGFFTNVSNFYRVDQERAYADRLADAIGGDPHFVVDVSRNGRGWRGTWCNPEGAGLGQAPHVTGGTTRLDALLWVKTPGLSDGSCNGGPPAGRWWEAYALALVEHRARD